MSSLRDAARDVVEIAKKLDAYLDGKEMFPYSSTSVALAEIQDTLSVALSEPDQLREALEREIEEHPAKTIRQRIWRKKSIEALSTPPAKGEPDRWISVEKCGPPNDTRRVEIVLEGQFKTCQVIASYIDGNWREAWYMESISLHASRVTHYRELTPLPPKDGRA